MSSSRSPSSKNRTAPKDQWYRVLDENEDFQRLLKNLRAIITETDPSGNISYVSQTVESVLGRRRDELLGQDRGRQVHPDDFGGIRARREQPIEAVGSQPVRFRVQAPDGQWHWIETVGSTRFVGDDGGVYGVSFSRDVTDLHKAEASLLETAERYNRIVQANDFLIVESDSGGHLRFVSDNCETILGFSPEEMKARKPFEGLHPDDLGRLRRQFRQAVETGKPSVLDRYRARHRDGHWVWVMSTGVGYTDDLGMQRFLNISRDITEQVEKEREEAALRARSEQAMRLESLGLMAGGIAHDFNNLLTPIVGQASLALADLPSTSPLYERLERIQRAARRASELTQQMMAYAGADEIDAEPIRLSEFVESTCRLVDARLGSGVTLKLEVASDLPVIVADSAQLTQVVMNLVTNAGEALVGGSGRIVVRTGQVEFAEAVDSPFLDKPLEPGQYVFVEVEDSGRGMDAATRARVFEPFFTTKFTGRGLGLASVLGIVKAHRGTVELETEPGQGTRFRVLFAAERSAPGAEVARDVEVPSDLGSRPTILVIDDDEDARDVVASSLERAGMVVLTASDGPSGLDLFEAQRGEIDAVLLDRVMPVVSGEETFERLRKLGIDVPVLLMSGYTEKGDSEKFSRRGAAGIIKKPFLPDDLCARVRALLGSD